MHRVYTMYVFAPRCWESAQFRREAPLSQHVCRCCVSPPLGVLFELLRGRGGGAGFERRLRWLLKTAPSRSLPRTLPLLPAFSERGCARFGGITRLPSWRAFWKERSHCRGFLLARTREARGTGAAACLPACLPASPGREGARARGGLPHA